VLFASTQFQAIVYHPDQSQLLTTGTDRKLTYWYVVMDIYIGIGVDPDIDVGIYRYVHTPLHKHVYLYVYQ
jgi:hypothetical protein